jgi:hypothetical protein
VFGKRLPFEGDVLPVLRGRLSFEGESVPVLRERLPFEGESVPVLRETLPFEGDVLPVLRERDLPSLPMNNPHPGGHGGEPMTFLLRRALTSVLVLVSLVGAHRADAQAASSSPSRRVVVVVVLPSAARLDVSHLRAGISDELGADVVAPEDSRAPSATGTLTVGLASSDTDQVTILYEARAERVSRQMPLPPAPGPAERAIVLLAGNMARDESPELALAVRERRAPKAALPASDTVYLKEGGFVRGVVLEESPTHGVRIQLPDGTTRTLDAAEIQRVVYGSAPTEAQPGGASHALRFGIGAEPVIWYVRAESSTSVGGRLFGRANVDFSPLVTAHVDLGVGVLEGLTNNEFGKVALSIPISVRADLQLNPARHYSLGLGVDLGVDIYRTEQENIVDRGGGPATGALSLGPAAAQGMLGLHVSPVTLRFGQANQFQLAAQESVFLLLSEGNGVFEQAVSFTYLFGFSP